MEDPKLEATRRLIRAAIEKAQGLDLSAALGREQAWEKEKQLLADKLREEEARARESKAAWDETRAGLEAENRKLRQEANTRLQELKDLLDEAQGKLVSQEAAFRRAERENQARTLKARIDELNAQLLEAERIGKELRASESAAQEQARALAAKLSEEESRRLAAQEDWKLQRANLEKWHAEAEQAAQSRVAELQKRLAELQEALDSARHGGDGRNTGLEAQLRQTEAQLQAEAEARKDWKREKAELLAKLQAKDALEEHYRQAEKQALQKIRELTTTLTEGENQVLAAQTALEQKAYHERTERDLNSRVLDLENQAEELRRLLEISKLETQRAAQEAAEQRAEHESWKAQAKDFESRLAETAEQLEASRRAAQTRVGELETRVKELQSLLESALRSGAARSADLESRLRQAAAQLQAGTESGKALEEDKATLTARVEHLQEELRQAHLRIAEARKEAETARAKAEAAQSKAETAQAKAAAAAQAPAAPSPADAIPPLPPLEGEPLPPMPPLEVALEPAWLKLTRMLQQPLASAYAHIRRLAAGRLPEGQRAVLKLAAGDLAAAQDSLKVVSQYLDDAAPPAVPGRLETLLSSTITVWEGAFRLRSLSIMKKFDPGIGQVLFHAETLRVALYQVLRNAYEAMPRGGNLTVTMSLDKATGQVRLAFSDTGGGFTQEALVQVFTPFFSTKPGHLGLGLALARRTIQSFGGDLEAANNRTGGGAVVTFRFPPPAPEAPPIQ